MLSHRGHVNAHAIEEPIDEYTTQPSDASFGDGSDLHEGQYFTNKNELKRKLSDIAMKGIFQFQMRKLNISLWVIECVDPNCSWRLRASRILPDSGSL